MRHDSRASRRSPLLLLAGLSVLVLGPAPPALAGGPLVIFQPGQPFLWPGAGQNIPFNPDQGGLGPLTNAQAVAQTTAAFQAWADLPTATATYFNAGPLAVDVDETNFQPFLFPTAPDGLSAIVYDEDGAIFTLLFGPGAGVLGFAGPEWIDLTNGTILEGVSFMNGGTLQPPISFPVAEMLSVQVHEFGHYSNLAHTAVNGQIPLGDTSGPTPNNTFPLEPLGGRIETMYPFLFVNGGQATPHPDDAAIFSTLYPEAAFAATTATITGRILGPNRVTPITGVNVIARNVANPYDDAVSALSSDFTDDFTPGAPFVGVYTLRGLTPGASYAVFVDTIIAGGFSTPPRVPLPGPEEFYNGAAESDDGDTDLPALFTTVSAGGGGTAGGIDIVFNRLRPGPIPLGLDQTIELFPSFPFSFCGQEWTSVLVNTSGNVTFGQGAPTAFLESVQGFLGGPPRIAALWDDLNPEAGGVVAFEETADTFTVSWTEVPEFPATGANSFSITLLASRGRGGDDDDDDDGDDDDEGGGKGGSIRVRYGALDAIDGLAGVSCGGRITSAFEQESDLRTRASQARRSIHTRGRTAVFEIFGFDTGEGDLEGLTLDYGDPGPFRDRLEPNGTLAQATRVKLPYNSGPETFAEIRPLGGDVDFFRFTATAGDILVLETVPGNQVDTMVGLFDASGALLALNDDGGAFGVGGLSRLAVIVPATGTYFAGVTTWPDFGFTGAGFDFGRYVVSINSYKGALLDLSDDDSQQVPLGFEFRFQGGRHTSVFVNGNGNLTFGAPDGDFSETVAELLSGPPRIAPLWDDLFPADGLVIAEHRKGALAIHFATVPEFFQVRPNYFTVELKKGGGIRMDWGPTSRGDAIVGITPGGGAADPGESDLSARRSWPLRGTTYERFTSFFSDFDLFFGGLKFGSGDDDDDD